MTFLLGAIILGLMGSLHCLGMCGPLLISVFSEESNSVQKWIHVFVYHFFRLVAYASLGLLPGFLGASIKFTGLQQWVSVLMGVIFIALFALAMAKRINVHLASWNKLSNYLYNLFSPMLNSQGIKKYMALGFLNGFIPCGMVYMALAAAFASSSIAMSSGFMFLFGLGTLPALLVTTAFGTLPARLKGIIPYGYLVSGMLLIYRGLFVEVPMNLSVLTQLGWDQMCH